MVHHSKFWKLSVTRPYWIFLLWIIASTSVHAVDVTNGTITSGNGVYWDANNDGQAEATLDIGGNLILLRSHADINAAGSLTILSNAISIGGNITFSSANIKSNSEFSLLQITSSNVDLGNPSDHHSFFNIAGISHFSTEFVSGNVTLSGNTYVFADSSSGNITLTLPSALTASGRRLVIKKTSASNDVTVVGFIDGQEKTTLNTSSFGLPYLSLTANGTQWHSMGTTGSVPAPQVGSANIATRWKMDESTGTTAYDESPNGNNGTLLNGVTFDANSIVGAAGTALHLDGVNDYMEVSSSASLSFGTGAFSFSIWIKPDVTINSSSATTQPIFTRIKDGNTNMHVAIRGTDYSGGFGGAGSVTVKVENSPVAYYWASSQRTWDSNQWHHIVVNFNKTGSASGIYINGVSDKIGFTAGTTSFDMSGFTAAHKWKWGRGDFESFNIAVSPKYFKGSIDDIRFFNRVLSQAEVDELYSLGTP
jgi:hypothetical protein